MILGFDMGFGKWRFLHDLLQIARCKMISDWSVACMEVGGSGFWCVEVCGVGEGVGVEGWR